MGKTDDIMTFIGSGRYSDVFKVTSGRQSVVMKLSYYRNNTLSDFISKLQAGDRVGARNVKNKDSIMVSAAFANATNALVAKRASPHFVFVYCNADVRNMAERLKTLLKDRIKSSSKIEMKYNNACFLELFHMDLTKWLKSNSTSVNDTNVRNAIFAVMYTLAVLQKVYRGFRHNDLSTNNVLVKKLRKPMKAGYVFDGTSYYIPSMPVLVAINDYDFTHVPNHPSLANERVINGKYKVTEFANKTYDSHFFLKTVLRHVNSKNKNLPATRAFLKALPFQTEDRLDATQVPGFEPEVLMKHAFFSSLRKPVPEGVDVYQL